MYDQRVIIAEAVREIQQENYLSPAIQREIVWKRDQITDLFDSVLQGYPIGTFLYWDIEDRNRDRYTMYGFIQGYITTTKYIRSTRPTPASANRTASWRRSSTRTNWPRPAGTSSSGAPSARSRSRST